MITNPTPVAATTFDGMWIQNLRIDAQGRTMAELLPYNGTHLLATGRVSVRRVLPKAAADAVKAECLRQSNIDAEFQFIHISAPSPDKPVRAMILYKGQQPYPVNDCFALAASDATFAEVFNSTMAAVAGLGGFAVS